MLNRPQERHSRIACGGCLTRGDGLPRTPLFDAASAAYVLLGLSEKRMANTASARKRIRQTTRRTARNQARKSRMRTFVKKVEAAIAGGDRTVATEALRVAQPEMQRAAGKGVVHKNTVARKLSRLAASIRKLSGT